MTAINTVRGKYDSVDDHGSGNPDLAVSGDIKGTISDESKDGEVSHFQALSNSGFRYCWKRKHCRCSAWL